MNQTWQFDTIAIHDENHSHQTKPIAQPIIPAVAYAFSTSEMAALVVSGEVEGTFYGRYGNPTTSKLEEKITQLEAGEASIGLSSGMAAISSAILALVQTGEHLLVTKDIYGGTYNFLTHLAPRFGIDFDFVDCTDGEAVQSAIKDNTKALYVETPSNPLLTIVDLRKLSAIAKEASIPLIVDNTFMSPYLQNPLCLGADVVVHSATKYINGHGDVLAGFVVGSKRIIEFIRKRIAGDLGQHLNAWDAFLILRGLKTMGIRMKAHCQHAKQIAEYLMDHPLVEHVFYPGLANHPQHQLAKQQMNDMGGIVSFELKGGLKQANDFMNQLKLIIISFSLGDPETLIQHPASMTHFSIPKEERLTFGISDGLLRLSVGLEDPSDIINDLEQALNGVMEEGVGDEEKKMFSK
ncbi:trans-sulfuration enzyme family protein [Amphibacillus cookii]|uniref:trans-sulfuration enzyme family protein n=1 Tax=Amphibacillus cookii TaxID=767787 RepID=UPI00195BB061|nr:aminotransferase class I/II-fold pyridoxal phosphate-dependent enzyme [Amphibacillus cookii]MBM7542213.1 methionine-gamma-lyase [Amphibacillus cookii]